MSDYRIKQEGNRFYPQLHFLKLFWVSVKRKNSYLKWQHSLEEAQEVINEFDREALGPTVIYHEYSPPRSNEVQNTQEGD